MSQQPPFDVDAEGAVLSACLLVGTERLDEIADVLTHEHFYSGRHRVIFQACESLAHDASPIDTVSVATWLRDHGKLEAAGGVGYLTEVIQSSAAVSSSALRQHATTVRTKAMLRDVLALCQKTAAEIYDGVAEADAFVQAFELDVHSATMARREASTRAFKEVLRESFTRLLELSKKGQSIGTPTGFADLDAMTGGLHPTDLTIVAGRPGMGKSAFVMGLTTNVALRGFGGVVFSLEMPAEQLTSRAMCSEARVNLRVLRTGQVSAGDLSRLTGSLGSIGNLPIFIDDTGDLPLSTMRTIVRRKQTELAQRGTPLAVVVVDYLQLMTGRTGKHTRDEAVSEITRGLKAMAKEAKVAVIALSQLNREVEKRSDKRPGLSDLRESGAIEQDADNVIFLYRDDYYDEQSREPRVAEVIVAKQRNGPTGTVKLRFHAESTRFDNLEHHEWAAE